MRVAPKKELGQHFLVDENILGVIGRLAELAPDDVVLEVGPGLGVLTRYLADARRARPRRRARRVARAVPARPRARTSTLHFGDALRLDLATLAPGARKLVANLPYNIATPLIAESLDGLPEIELWCVMVQREVADRLFAAPSTKAYGAVSVLVQLAAERIGFHPVSRTVFRPPPNVSSALVAFRRTGAARRLQAREAGRHRVPSRYRRKTLPNSLEIAGLASRERAVEALAAIGREPSVRAEALAPPEFLALAEALR